MTFWIIFAWLMPAFLLIFPLEPFFKAKMPEAATANTLFYAFGWPVIFVVFIGQLLIIMFLGFVSLFPPVNK